MKDRSFYILLVAILLLSLMALMLWLFLHKADEEFEGSILVKENGITETLIPVRDLTLVPGDKKEYDIKLVCQASGSYFIHLDFEERDDGGMKEFVNVVVEFDGVQVYEGRLTELLDDGKIIETEDNLYAEDPVIVTVRYIMPIETGNEAQGTSSDFDIHVVINKS